MALQGALRQIAARHPHVTLVTRLPRTGAQAGGLGRRVSTTPEYLRVIYSNGMGAEHAGRHWIKVRAVWWRMIRSECVVNASGRGIHTRMDKFEIELVARCTVCIIHEAVR